MKPTVYLADLRHNYSGVLANDCAPLCVGYLKAVMDQKVPEAKSRIFAYADRLCTAIKDSPPDVLMLSNYMWNEALSRHVASYAKRIRPDMLVVFGGPNIPVEPERQIAWVEKYPEMDVYILGEADFIASEVLQHFLDAGMSLERFRERSLPSSVFKGPDGKLVRNEMRDRSRTIDEIPSPHLTGVLDEFYDGKLAPMIETNRGCPFKCTFCVQGTDWYTKVNYFELERLKEELAYMSRAIGRLSPSMGTLRIVDANFGMFERDVDLCEHIGHLQKDTGWPTYIDATTGKNRPDRVIRAIEKVNGALVVYQAVQSLDEEVLTRIKRQNISLDAYKDVMIHIRGRGLRSNSDLILALPGETLQSHLAALKNLLNAGTDHMHNLQLVLLMGSELETLESRKNFAFVSRFRVIPKMAGIYGDGMAVDIEEVVVQTDKMSFEDYLVGREHHLAISAFWNNGWFEHVIKLAHSFGLENFDWIEGVIQKMRTIPNKARDYRNDFLNETRNELFPTRAACEEFYMKQENFEQLLLGRIGDNLIYKYRAIASFRIWPDIVACAMEATKDLLESRGARAEIPDFDAFWSDLSKFIELGHAHGNTTEEVLSDAKGTLGYDIDAWIAAGLPKDVRPFKHATPVEYAFVYEPESRHLMARALEVWSFKGLTRLVTRIVPSWQTRRAVPAK